MDIFQKISTKVLHSPRLAESEDAEQWILRANYKAIVRFWLHRGLCACVLSCFSLVWLFSTLYTIAHQAPLSMGFSRQEYLSVWPCPLPADLLHSGIRPMSLMSLDIRELAGRVFITSTIWEGYLSKIIYTQNLVCVNICIHMCVYVYRYTMSEYRTQGEEKLVGPWDSPDKNTGVVCNFLLLWTMFCQSSSL